MSEVSNVNSGIEFYTPSNKADEPPKMDLGADDFMNLFMTQLTNQNPLEPMEESDMIAQMAQMNSVNELELLNATVKELTRSNALLSASNLIGKEITYENANGEIVTGVVEFVSMDEKEANLIIGEEEISLNDVLKVA